MKLTIKILNLQFLIALILILNSAICAKIEEKLSDSNQINQNQLDTSSILSNYHSDAEQISRTNNNFENKSKEQTVNTLNGQLKNAKYDTQLKIIKKRSARNYNFGLGKRDKPQQLTDEQIKEFLNYLYNIDFNSLLNYIYDLNEDDSSQLTKSQQQIPSASYKSFKLVDNFDNDLDDDLLDVNLAEKYKSKRDIQLGQQKLNRYAFGLGKKKRSPNYRNRYSFGVGKRQYGTNFGLPSRFDEYMKRRYSFGIGKRSIE